jgi:hypothetical protein
LPSTLNFDLTGVDPAFHEYTAVITGGIHEDPFKQIRAAAALLMPTGRARLAGFTKTG